MNLYLLRRLGEYPRWDVSDGFVVRAETEDAARSLAAVSAGDEGAKTWTRSETSSCAQIAADVSGKAEIVLQDFNAG